MKLQPSARRRERGLAVLVLLILLGLIGALIAANQVTLRSLHRELELLERQQARKYGTRTVVPPPISPVRTNAVAGLNPNPAATPPAPQP